MSSSTDRARKAAETRARNAALQRQAEQRLIEETRGGRSAKQRAGDAWSQFVPAARKTKGVTEERGVAGGIERDDLFDGGRGTGKRRSVATTPRAPRAPVLDEEDLPKPAAVEGDDESDQRTVVEDDSEEGDDDDDDADEEDPEEEFDESGDDAGPMNDDMLELERPRIVPQGSDARKRPALVDEGISDDDGGKEQEQPAKAGVTAIFDDDEDDGSVETVPRRRAATQHHNANSSSSDEDEPERERCGERNRSVPKSRQRARDVVFNYERPRVQRAKSAPQSKAKGRTNVSSSSNHAARPAPRALPPASTHKYSAPATLIPRKDGKKGILLLEQHWLLRKVVDEAIDRVTKDMIVERAWPEAAARMQYGVTTLLAACDLIAKRYPQASDIADRLKEDEDFAHVLVDLAVDRLSGNRHRASKSAHAQVSAFKLGLGSECREKVKILFTKHVYIFPGKWGGDDGMTWIPNTREPFLSPAIIETLKNAYFICESSLGYRFKNLFKVTTDGSTEYEISASLLALAATAVYHSLYEYQTGEHKSVPFHGNLFISAYESHIRTLDKLAQDRPSRYRDIVRRVFASVATRGDAHDAGDEDDAYNLIDLESD